MRAVFARDVVDCGVWIRLKGSEPRKETFCFSAISTFILRPKAFQVIRLKIRGGWCFSSTFLLHDSLGLSPQWGRWTDIQVRLDDASKVEKCLTGDLHLLSPETERVGHLAAGVKRQGIGPKGGLECQTMRQFQSQFGLMRLIVLVLLFFSGFFFCQCCSFTLVSQRFDSVSIKGREESLTLLSFNPETLVCKARVGF